MYTYKAPKIIRLLFSERLRCGQPQDRCALYYMYPKRTKISNVLSFPECLDRINGKPCGNKWTNRDDTAEAIEEDEEEGVLEAAE